MNTIETIQRVINTLNIVSVSGADNLNHLLGSIHTLSKLKTELEGQEARKQHENNPED